MLEICFGNMLWRHSPHVELFIFSMKLSNDVKNFFPLGKSDHSLGAQ